MRFDGFREKRATKGAWRQLSHLPSSLPPQRSIEWPAENLLLAVPIFNLRVLIFQMAKKRNFWLLYF
jgi:hypothetical protein